LRDVPEQYWIERATHGTTFACLDRVGLEWHLSWGTAGGRGELGPRNVQAFIREMQVAHFPATLYWLVDGVPCPDWNRNYSAVVQDIFAEPMAKAKDNVSEHLDRHWKSSPEDHAALLVDHYLGQEFEANGCGYYIVFVASGQFLEEERDQLDKAKLGCSGPFPGSAAMWLGALREPAENNQ
jgi:hypothetical protein